MTTVYLILSIILLNVVYRTTASTVNINPEDHKCWIGWAYLPCKKYELIKAGTLYLNVSGEQVLQIIYSNLKCQQDLLDTLQKSLCTKDKREGVIHELLHCGDNSVISVRDCDCVT